MSNDARISQYRDAIEAKRKTLGLKPQVSYVTNALLPLDGNKINLNTLQTQDECVQVAGRLILLEDCIERANKVLKTKVEAKVGDFTVDQWLGDIQQRSRLIAWEGQRKKLGQMDDQLKTLMSDDAKTADAIASIAAQLEG